MSNADYVIEMRNITKTFPGVVANDDITLKLRKGEIHALLGENGAGKSTLMSVLFGLYTPDKGSIYINGEKVFIRNPNDATKLNIGMVHQHFKLVECFTVLDNIILGVENSVFGFVSKTLARKKVEDLMEKYGLEVDLDAKVEDISVGMQQRTEILKMLFRDNEILIFDEPTAVLTPHEIDELMDTMKGLVKEGKSILFISHKLNEILEVSDTCSILRKGKLVKTLKTKDTNVNELAELMVGKEVHFSVDKKSADPKEKVLEIQNLKLLNRKTKKSTLNINNIYVRKGEIVAIAGIEGNGQTEFAEVVTGLRPFNSGKILFFNENYSKKNIRYRNTHGFSHIPEDRHKHGLILNFSLQENLILQRYFEDEFSNHGFINFDKVREYSDKLIKEYDIRSGQGGTTITRSMSGGNQQKAIIARELDREHSLLVAVQPTRGLDVGAVETIHKQIIKGRDKGDAVLLISLELDEVMSLADRIYVMFEGEIVGEFDPKTISVKELGLYMSGAKRQSDEGAGRL